MADKWYYVVAGERQGPVGFEKVNTLYSAGQLTEDPDGYQIELIGKG